MVSGWPTKFPVLLRVEMHKSTVCRYFSELKLWSAVAIDIMLHFIIGLCRRRTVRRSQVTVCNRAARLECGELVVHPSKRRRQARKNPRDCHTKRAYAPVARESSECIPFNELDFHNAILLVLATLKKIQCHKSGKVAPKKSQKVPY